jgi:RNA polymerase sigma factor (sigma-70 family)
MTAPTLAALLEEFRIDLHSYVTRHAGWLLRYEAQEDLLQGVHVRILESEFRYEGRKPFLKWLYIVARTYLADRADYWSALKRQSAKLVRLTRGATPSSDPGAAPEPAGTVTGPSTFAVRREQLALAVRVLDALLPRDRDLVKWSSEGVPLEEMAGHLDISYAAAQRAHLRALGRFRDAYGLATGRNIS